MRGEKVHVFTSAAVNYLPKARVLAQSIRKYHPEFTVHLALADPKPAWLDVVQEPFDSVVSWDELDIPNSKSWIFMHSLVEFSTAIKPFVLRRLLSADADLVLYFDPDIVLLSRIDDLLEQAEGASIVLTPHLTKPETSIDAILDNEISSLRHGIFNLGFVGASATQESRAFADWWAVRTYNFCREARTVGLFTDQKWVDLAPIFFENARVLRDPRFNVAPWNLSTRRVSGSLETGLLADGKPIGFYHFTGFDSGDHEAMVGKYAADAEVLHELIHWYRQQTQSQDPERASSVPWAYGRFSNGVQITAAHRLIYRLRKDLQAAYPDPFQADGSDSYLRWFGRRARVEHGRKLLRDISAADSGSRRLLLAGDPGHSSTNQARIYVARALSDRRDAIAIARRALQILRTEGIHGLRSRLRQDR